MAAAPSYAVEDKSLLLPLYKRVLVDPVLRLIPAWVRPNWITHFGHAVCLMGVVELVAVRPTRGLPMFVGMVLLQLYLLCDNVDGAHARRTSQCSVTGEYLDHGLDLLNSSYIGVMASVAIGTSGTMTVVLTALVSGAAAVTCWEQAETGVFRLGMLNQIESVTLVTVLLTVSAFDSSAFWTNVHVGPVNARLAIVGFSCATIVFGMLRAMIRVRGTGRPVAPPLTLLALFAVASAGTWLGRLPTAHAVAVCLAGSVAMGCRMLTARLRGEALRMSGPLAASAVAVGAFVVVASVGGLAGRAAQVVGLGLAGTLCAVFAVLAAMDARETFARLARGG